MPILAAHILAFSVGAALGSNAASGRSSDKLVRDLGLLALGGGALTMSKEALAQLDPEKVAEILKVAGGPVLKLLTRKEDA